MNQETPTQTKATSNPFTAAQLEQQAHVHQVASKQNKNPLMASNSLDRQAGVYAKGLRLLKGKKFQALDDENKQHVLGQYYDTYVSPAYQYSNTQPPDKDTWVREFSKPGGPKMRVSDFYLNTGKATDAGTDFKATFLNIGAAATRTLGKILNGPIVAGIKADDKLFGLKGFFPAPEGDNWRSHLLAEDKKIVEDKAVKGFMRMNQGMIDDANFWFQSRPTSSFSEKAGSFVGEQAVQLPLYEAIGALRGLGAVATGADKLLKVAAGTGTAATAVKSANLTRRLIATPVGKFVAHRLGEAADAYIGGTLLQESSEDKTRDVLAFMGFGAALEGLGKGGAAGVRIINKAAMKQQLTNELAIGGVPYVEAIHDQAAHELNNDIIGYDHNGQPLQLTSGHSLEDAKEAIRISHAADPVKAKTVTAAKVTLASLAKEMHGPDTVWKNLSKSKQALVRKELAKRTAEAVQEIPLHVPEVAQHEIQQSIKKDIAQSPQLKNTYAQLDALGKDVGVNVANATQAGELDGIKDATGQRSVQGATNKVVKPAKQAQTIKTEKAEALEKAPRNYVSFKMDTIARFSNNFKSTAQKENKTLEKYIKGLDDDDFVKEVDDQMGNKIHFEKPFDLMLWAVHHGGNIPNPVYNRAIRWLKDQDPTQTIETLRKQARQLDNHIELLAYSGRLDAQGNVFRSTVTSDYGSRTKWQRQLLAEVAQEEVSEFSSVMGAYKKNFPQQYNAGLAMLAKLQAARSKVRTLEAAIEKTDTIRAYILGGKL